MQQQGGGRGGGGQAASAAAMSGDEHHQKQVGDLGFAEAASPISSRPPAATNFEELMRASTAAEAGGSSGNRWPRQETLALLQIRSEMDAAFRDATPKAPLWEQVSRKLGELGYSRSGKKCKEKFENVQKYYKRTKEGRGGRQDGKSYKFFTQLEALHHHHNPSTTTIPTPVQVNLPNPTSTAAAISLPPPSIVPSPDHHHHDVSTAAAVPLYGANIPSSSSSSSSEGEDYDDDDDDDMEEVDIGSSDRNRKRKRNSSLGGGDNEEMRMMEFFEGLMRQVMHKQEAMQQKFLEAIERREQDRMIREEAWKRHDMERRAREHELLAKERAISASRDAAIVAFLEKITGQTICLPTSIQVPQNPQPPVQLPVPVPKPQRQQQQQQPTFQQPQSEKHHQHQPGDRQFQNVPSHPHFSTVTEPATTATPEQQRVVPQQQNLAVGSSGLEMAASSSRWPRTEVLALIQLRSGLESRYQEAGPKGPLWEEISAGMRRMGYNRSAKRCKEKWENINKYFKKVKESNKKRPEDAKTCPYFHELDALYKKKLLGNTSGGIIIGSSSEQEIPKQQEQQNVGGGIPQIQYSNESSDDKNRGGSTELHTSTTLGAISSSLVGEQNQGTSGGANQPEDMLKKQHQQSHGNMIDDCINAVISNGDNLDPENDEGNYEEVDEDEEYDDKTEEEMKMAYKIQFQRQNSSGTPSTSFMAMVQ